MYQFSYVETLDEDSSNGRQRERDAIAHSIDMLQAGEAAGTRSRETIEALLFTRRLWSVLIEDLANTNNDLADSLRADLISIGLWIMRECEHIRTGRSDNFKGLVDISRIILEGLK